MASRESFFLHLWTVISYRRFQMKLLVATAFPPNAPGGGPAVVRQMLRGLAPSALRPPPSSMIAPPPATPDSQLFWWSCHADKETHFGQEVSGFSCAAIPSKLMPTRRFTKLKACVLEHVWAPWAAAHLRRTIARLSPECIWVIPHDWSIFPLWRVMVNSEWRMANGQRPRIHVTIQDYPDAHHHGALWGEARAKRMARMQEDIYRLATNRDATSHPMLEDLEKRTGAKGFQMLHAGLEAEDFDFLDKPATRHQLPATRDSSPIRVAYAGTILVPREFALFVAALESIRAKQSITKNPSSKISIELHLWGAHSYKTEPWFRTDWMIEHGNLPESELLTALRHCDWGFIPMALEDLDPRYNRFSFPTKFITYLAAGLPVIAMGHPDSSVMKMASSYGVGLTISSARVPVEDLAKTLADRGARDKCRAEALRCAREQFDAEKMRNRLYSCFAGDGEGA